MNKKLPTTEALLKKGKGIFLTETERADIKSELFSYAEYHGMRDTNDIKPARIFSVWVRTLAASSLALVLFFGTAYASTDSLPGEALYAMKVNVFEEMIAATKITEPAQLEYNLVLAERRITEVHELAESNSFTEANLDSVAVQLVAVVDDVIAIIDGDKDKSIDAVFVLDVTNDVAAIMKATGKIVEKKVSAEAADRFEDVVDEAVVVHADAVTEFVLTESTDMVKKYIEIQLNQIAAEIAENDSSEAIQAQTKERIEDMNDALEMGNVSKAGQQVSDILIDIETQEYFLDHTDEITESKNF